MNQLSNQREAKGETVFKFGFGQSPFPVPTEIQKALSEAAHRKEYMSVQGHPPLREAIANFHHELEGKNWSADGIIVGTGSKILIYCLLAALKQAEVLLPAPSWVSYAPQAKLAGHNVSWLRTNSETKWKLTPSQLEKVCIDKKKLNIPLILIFNYPSNPTGQTYNSRELQELASVLRKYEVIVVADEIYSLLTYAKDYATLEEFYPEGCIVTSGLSKWCGAGGWRLGFCHIPKSLGQEYFDAVLGVASETYSSAPSPVQLGACQAYQNTPLTKAFLNKQVNLLKKVEHYCRSSLTRAGVNVHTAQGGFYLFPDFEPHRQALKNTGIENNEDLCNTIMKETGVALLPGNAFGMPDASLTARLAFVDFDGGQIFREDQKEPEFEKAKQGIDKLCHWLLAL
ncbi:MAG: pyridoxal phosphate-dependent aminotransferase [Cellvibrionaceae bacterium]|nr:pyridoxal phosphate-dependent aminotransferase [Cellvibrionaceae bacterium]